MIKIVSIFWSLGSLLRRFFCKRKKLDCFVVSIGNLQAGGAGKTPVLMALASALLQKKWRVGVLTRGYGGTREKKSPFCMG